MVERRVGRYRERLEDALARLAGIEEEKKHWLFMEEVH